MAAMTLAPFAAFGADEPKPAAASTVELKSDVDKFSYAIGVNIGRNLKKDKIELNKTFFMQAIQDVTEGKPLALTDEQLQQTIMEFQKTLMAKRQEADKVAGDKNVTEGKAFLEANAKKEGIKVLPSGLQYKVIKEGDGPTPKASDTVKTNYKGTLIDGTVFDASEKHGGPATFPVGQVIKGWTEALQLMKVGSKWQLFVPSELAYGPKGAGGDIGPNATLIFEIELLGIDAPAAAAKPDAGTLIK
ncbi:MAG: FKBP-type peptidyl-prolyl cis-trans isomerase [Candidatus Hydrogenedentes bacterium]|nr:FKBP-type peptidyl-prolyl cis-trans isomerase [Candidatus Hydrogenedentota bacterium]